MLNYDPAYHEALKSVFPGLRSTSYTITSEDTRRYNCIAWAAGGTAKWWWPKTHYWPPGCPVELAVDSFVDGFGTLGYVSCDDGVLEEGIEKIAIYAKEGCPTHAARQLRNGRWTSKLGAHVDIEHEVDGLDCESYGEIVRFLKRPRALTASRA